MASAAKKEKTVKQSAKIDWRESLKAACKCTEIATQCTLGEMMRLCKTDFNAVDPKESKRNLSSAPFSPKWPPPQNRLEEVIESNMKMY